MADSPEKPLQFLDHFIGGSWHYIPPDEETPLRMVHTFSWKVEGYLLYSESVSPNGTSYAFWYWHPANQRVQAISLGGALEGINLLEYTEIAMQEEMMVCAMTAQEPEGPRHYREEWVFPDKDHYDWKLFALDDGEKEVMQANFERRN